MIIRIASITHKKNRHVALTRRNLWSEMISPPPLFNFLVKAYGTANRVGGCRIFALFYQRQVCLKKHIFYSNRANFLPEWRAAVLAWRAYGFDAHLALVICTRGGEKVSTDSSVTFTFIYTFTPTI